MSVTKLAAMKASKASPRVKLKDEVVVKRERINNVKPQWVVNDRHLFASIDEVLRTGIQMSASSKDLSTTKLKPQVMNQIMDSFNRRKDESPLDKGQARIHP